MSGSREQGATDLNRSDGGCGCYRTVIVPIMYGWMVHV